MRFFLAPCFSEAAKPVSVLVRKTLDKPSRISPQGREVRYSVLRKGQGKAGILHGSVIGRRFNVGWAGAMGGSGYLGAPLPSEVKRKRLAGEHFFSPEDIRHVTRRIGKHFPWVTHISADRVSGARPEHKLLIPLPRPLGKERAPVVDRGMRFVPARHVGGHTVNVNPMVLRNYTLHHPTLGPVAKGVQDRGELRLHTFSPDAHILLGGRRWRMLRALKRAASKIPDVTHVSHSGHNLPIRRLRPGVKNKLYLGAGKQAEYTAHTKVYPVKSHRYPGSSMGSLSVSRDSDLSRSLLRVHTPYTGSDKPKPHSFGTLRRLYRSLSSKIVKDYGIEKPSLYRATFSTHPRYLGKLHKLRPEKRLGESEEESLRRGMRDAGLPPHVEVPPIEIGIRKLISSGRYRLKAHAAADRDHYKVEIHPRPTRHVRRAGKVYYDHRYAELTPHPVWPDQHIAQLKKDSGLHDTIPEPKDVHHVWRGMSHEEWHGALRSGYIKSHALYNLGPSQAHTTSFSHDPDTARVYAHAFAPKGHQATFHRPAYLVKIPKPADAVPEYGKSDENFDVPNATPISHVKAVYRGRVYAMKPGYVELRPHYRDGKVWHISGSSMHPSASVGWEKVHLPFHRLKS